MIVGHDLTVTLIQVILSRVTFIKSKKETKSETKKVS